MRVLYLTHRLPYAPNRGDRVRAYNIVRLLSEAHEVHLVSLVHDDEEVAHLGDVRNIAAAVHVARVHRLTNRLLAVLALPGSRPLTHLLLHSSAMSSVLRRLVLDAPPDVVIAYCSGMARYACAPPLARFPCVFDMVDVDSEKWAELSTTSRWPKRWLYRREAGLLRKFERYAMNHAYATTVVSERERVVLDGVMPHCRISVVQNGVDLSSLTPQQPPTNEPRVIFCGVFDYEPNVAGAVWVAREVWPLVKQVEPRAELTLLGMNPTRAVRALEDDSSIRVTGTVPDVRTYLWQSAVSIAPLWLSRGVQNKVLEAIAAGLPCVVTPPVFEGLPHAVRQACISAPDAQSFADGILRLLRKSPEDRRAIATGADLSELSWRTQLQPFMDLIVSAKLAGPRKP